MKKLLRLTTRKDPADDVRYSPITIRATPNSLDEQERSVEIVLATETPCLVYDFERYELVNEICLASGCQFPDSRQVPLLNVHSRFDTSDVYGSIRNLKKVDKQIVGRAVFSAVESTEETWQKVREGHLTDFSAGYKQIESFRVAEGESKKYRGVTYEGPIMVTTKWKLREGSIVPIGADEFATARSAFENNKNLNREVKPMDERLRLYLESRGLGKDASEEDAWRFLSELNTRDAQDAAAATAAAAGAPDTGPTQAEIDQIRTAATGEERERVDGLIALGTKYDCVELANTLIRDGVLMDLARMQIADAVLERNVADDQMQHFHPATHGEDGGDKFRLAAQDSLMMRTTMYNDGSVKIEKPAPGADELRGYSLRELARECLRAAGKPQNGHVLKMVGRALTVSDLPAILANVAHKALFVGWDTAPESWSLWCGTDTAEDFKTHTVARGSEASDLEEIPEHGGYNYGKMTDAKEEYALATYGKLFAITRQTIINDDLSALTKIPAAHGEAASRKVGDVAYAVLTANAAMGDGLALFVSGHANFVANGSGAAPGIDTLAAGILAMGVQKDLQGLRRLNIRPEYLIAPKALEGPTEVFLTSTHFSDHSTVATDSTFASTRTNPYSGAYFNRVYDARLDDDDAAAWYLAARKGKTVVVFFLGGVQKPYTEQRQGWTVDGTEFKVRVDVGAKALDWTGLYMNDGN